MTESHVLVNRAGWDADADNWVEPGRQAWATDEITWGAWSVPESDLRVLPDVDGLDVIELGCGTAYWSAWLARRGARPVGLDNSTRQLATAMVFQREFDLRFPLVHADADRRSATGPSTSRSPSTARRSGAIRTTGSRKQGACSVRADG